MATFFTAALAASVLLVAVHPGAVNAKNASVFGPPTNGTNATSAAPDPACSADDYCVDQAYASSDAYDSCIYGLHTDNATKSCYGCNFAFNEKAGEKIADLTCDAMIAGADKLKTLPACVAAAYTDECQTAATKCFTDHLGSFLTTAGAAGTVPNDVGLDEVMHNLFAAAVAKNCTAATRILARQGVSMAPKNRVYREAAGMAEVCKTCAANCAQKPGEDVCQGLDAKAKTRKGQQTALEAALKAEAIVTLAPPTTRGNITYDANITDSGASGFEPVRAFTLLLPGIVALASC